MNTHCAASCNKCGVSNFLANPFLDPHLRPLARPRDNVAEEIMRPVLVRAEVMELETIPSKDG